MQNLTINLYHDNSEKVPYNNPEIPIYAGKAFVSSFPHSATLSHWHDDLEFLLILSGYMNYNVNGHTYQLKEGNGIFVNSRQLHFEFCDAGTDCEYICVLLHPILLCTNPFIEQTYVSPVIFNQNFPYKILSSSISWEKEILSLIVQIYETEMRKEETHILSVQSIFYRLFILLFEHNIQSVSQSTKASYRLSSLKDMIGYIQKNYCKKITVGEIASVGKLCKSNCCKIFQNYLHQTPIGYLTDYRLFKSIDLLRNTEKTVTEIGYEVGFSSASYFTETFRKYMHCTPTQYRKKLNDDGSDSHFDVTKSAPK